MATSYRSDSRTREIYKVTLVGSIGNLLLLILKFIAGIVGHSAAMLADAVHSLSDFATDIVVILFVRISSKPRDNDHDYGHGKYETLATVAISLALFAVGIGIFVKGLSEVIRFLHGETLEAPGMIALIAAVVSIIFKEILYQYTVRAGRKLHSKAVEANAWHHRSDALSSIGTTVGIAGAIFFGVKARVLDPVAAIIVSLFIIYVAFRLLKTSIGELLEKSLPEETEKKILDTLKDIPEVTDPHNLRTRQIGNYAAVDIHIRVDADLTVAQAHDITKDIEQRIEAAIGPDTIINIHVEPKHS